MIHIRHTRLMASGEQLEKFAKQDAATLHEAMGRRGAMDCAIKPIARGMKLCGRALTVKCHAGDNLMLIKAVQMARAGDVIVADMGNVVRSGPFGEVLAVECARKKVAGLVASCCVRDSEAIARLGFPVFSAGLCVCGTVKATLGTINHPIVCGGVVVEPGDVVLGDDDGVVVVPLAEAAEVLAAANRRREAEGVVMERLREGESLFDIYGYGDVLERLGCLEEK